jgi:hypothetical protein
MQGNVWFMKGWCMVKVTSPFSLGMHSLSCLIFLDTNSVLYSSQSIGVNFRTGSANLLFSLFPPSLCVSPSAINSVYGMQLCSICVLTGSLSSSIYWLLFCKDRIVLSHFNIGICHDKCLSYMKSVILTFRDKSSLSQAILDFQSLYQISCSKMPIHIILVFSSRSSRFIQSVDLLSPLFDTFSHFHLSSSCHIYNPIVLPPVIVLLFKSPDLAFYALLFSAKFWTVHEIQTLLKDLVTNLEKIS